MRYDPYKHNRQSMRAPAYDYAWPGWYAVTIGVHNRQPLFGDVVQGTMRLNATGRMIKTVWNEIPERFRQVGLDTFVVMPNHIHGIIVIRPDTDWDPDTRMGESCIRPCDQRGQDRANTRFAPTQLGQGSFNRSDGNQADGTTPRGTAPGSLGRIIQAFKSITTHHYIRGVKHEGWPPFDGRLWQRSFYDHIIRDDADLDRIRTYIANNPANWHNDDEHPINR